MTCHCKSDPEKTWSNNWSQMSAADVKMKIPGFIGSLNPSIPGSTSFQLDKTFSGVVSAGVEQSRQKGNMVAQGDEKLGP